MKHAILILTILLCFGCNQNKPDSETLFLRKIEHDTAKTENVSNKQKSESPSSKKTESVEGDFDYSETEFEQDFSNSVSHYFSNDSIKDVFSISVPTGNINQTESSISILTAFGDTIYYEEFATSYLIYPYGLYEIKSNGELINHIKEKIESNLASSAFENLTNNQNKLLSESDRDDYENYQILLECKTANRPLYIFTLGEESSTYLGYSEELKKAVPIIYCC